MSECASVSGFGKLELGPPVLLDVVVQRTDKSGKSNEWLNKR